MLLFLPEIGITVRTKQLLMQLNILKQQQPINYHAIKKMDIISFFPIMKWYISKSKSNYRYLICAVVSNKQQPGRVSSQKRKRRLLSLYPTNPTSVGKLMLSFFLFMLISWIIHPAISPTDKHANWHLFYHHHHNYYTSLYCKLSNIEST